MSKDTPKKFYSASGENQNSCCQLCLKICDVTHAKKLFRATNANLVKIAEDCLGDQLVRDQNLPQNICRPCERRLANYSSFKELISKSQESLKSQSRTKRCPDPSPTGLPAAKRAERLEGRAFSSRRSLAFSPKENLVSLVV